MSCLLTQRAYATFCKTWAQHHLEWPPGCTKSNSSTSYSSVLSGQLLQGDEVHDKTSEFHKQEKIPALRDKMSFLIWSNDIPWQWRIHFVRQCFWQSITGNDNKVTSLLWKKSLILINFQENACLIPQEMVPPGTGHSGLVCWQSGYSAVAKVRSIPVGESHSWAHA